jgi:hypothetical protein
MGLFATLSIECHYVECRDFYCYAECRCAECRYAECHYAECHGAVTYGRGSCIFQLPVGSLSSIEMDLGKRVSLLGPRGLNYKTFYGRNLWIFVIR